ncbi:HU family DNA-binding protein [Pseudanabaena sp. PCC 6802]|uniref:HU family DNA-binding protein n=1 Tax=Pseudanabaena sp. PCC 6802 TaxID=118173 RepID=UPI00034BD296|nr:HU family DNA-binding protein [Pseudanabaena sp. PCC 6802]
MNQLELAQAIAQELQIGGYDADRFLTAALNRIKTTVTAKVPVELQGFGTFSIRPQAPRVGRNPATGEPLDIPARWSASFKIDKAFKAVVDQVPLDRTLPFVAGFTAPNIMAASDKPYTFTVSYNDEGVGILTSSIGKDEMKPENLDIRVTSPTGNYSQMAKATKTKKAGSTVAVTYMIGAPGGMWDASSDGRYTIELLPGQIKDAQGNILPPGPITSFVCNVSGTWQDPPTGI